jgi:hypothetical protein
MNDELKESGRPYEYQSTNPIFACNTGRNYEQFKIGGKVFRPRL